ncbi:hypothetical protein P691DRAFT_761147 [Macrolepiota fuliginosa MF-IS2]|uniref:Uncharacterized protein n=1 Tax=Macrolepiota fuliginosa MF-IS2 TaxID=1400762 RepID=A0A9P5X9N4_9AGAR|nr:hypothetical protein P691DRAFT_761147 [Macrolepiota fuliginosa MF-IS2]
MSVSRKDNQGFQADLTDRDIKPVDPFDLTHFYLMPNERLQVVGFIAVHAIPTGFVGCDGRRLLKWQLVLVSADMKKTVIFDVKNRRGRKGPEIYIAVSSRTSGFDNNIDRDNFWWHRSTYWTCFNGPPCFQYIIDLLERANNRYERWVDPFTLEGTFVWVREIVSLLERGGHVKAEIEVNGRVVGCNTSVVEDLEMWVSNWLVAYTDVYYCV